MIMKTIRLQTVILTSVVALGLLSAATNATALTNSAPANAIVSATNTLPAQTTLTPVAPLSSSPAFQAGEDIRDIRQPRHMPTPGLWFAAAAGVIIFLATASAGWLWLRRKQAVILLPHEIALQHLEVARQLIDPEHAREYCFAASKIIRSYIEEQLHLHAPRLTTEEFLRELVEGRDKIGGGHRALLEDFLQHCDLAKFGGWRYSQESLAEMHAGAVQFVRQSSVPPTSTPAPDKSSVNRPAATTTTVKAI